MARSELRAKIRLEGDSSGADKALKSTQKELSKLDKTATSTTKSMGARFADFGRSLRTAAISVAAAVASVTGAYKLLEAAGARIGQQRALSRSLAAEGKSADEFIAKLKQIANQQIATSDIILATNRAIALGISTNDIPGLLDAATKASVALGISATQAFNDIATGVGRASPLILDNLGIVVDSVKIYKDYAAAIGISVEELTKQQKTTALAAAVMRDAAKGADDFAAAQSRISVALSQTVTGLKDFLNGLTESVAANEKFVGTFEGGIEDVRNFAGAIRFFDEALKRDAEQQAINRRATLDWTGALDLLTLNISFATRAFLALGAAQRELEDVQAEAAENAAKLTERWEAQNQEMLRSLGFLDAWGSAQERAADRTARIEAGILAEASALEALGDAIGIVTSAQLEQEALAIAAALAKARLETQPITQEFLDMEQFAVDAIDSIRFRIDGMQRGLGDVGKEAADAALGIEDFSKAIKNAGTETEKTGAELGDLGESLDGAAEGATDLKVGMTSATESLSKAAAQARITAAEFDKIAESAGRAAAVSAALAGGGQLTQGGARISVPGGSRLTYDPRTGRPVGLNSYSLSPFGTGGRYTVNPDGTLRPR